MHGNENTDEALEIAGHLAINLGTPTALGRREKDREVLARFDGFRFGFRGNRQAWAVGYGPQVVLVHGYNGMAAQMAPIARDLEMNGYRAILFDAGGHGESASHRVGFDTFIEDTQSILEEVGPVHALIGHSAGGLAMMRARDLHRVGAERYGVIAAPLFPYVPLDAMRERGAPEEALRLVKAVLGHQFQSTWSALVAGLSFAPEAGKPMLAVYDRDDERVDHRDGDAISRLWPEARVVKTSGYGHNRVLAAPETLAAVRELVAS